MGQSGVLFREKKEKELWNLWQNIS